MACAPRRRGAAVDASGRRARPRCAGGNVRRGRRVRCHEGWMGGGAGLAECPTDQETAAGLCRRSREASSDEQVTGRRRFVGQVQPRSREGPSWFRGNATQIAKACGQIDRHNDSAGQPTHRRLAVWGCQPSAFHGRSRPRSRPRLVSAVTNEPLAWGPPAQFKGNCLPSTPAGPRPFEKRKPAALREQMRDKTAISRFSHGPTGVWTSPGRIAGS